MAVATAHEVDLDAPQLRGPDLVVATDDVDPDGLLVFCEFSSGSARTQGGFCLHCGACDHEYV
ncbi:hypothetical protein [Georgenia subflava]|nr:hypothetical protein [Georgenia subflava]